MSSTLNAPASMLAPVTNFLISERGLDFSGAMQFGRAVIDQKPTKVGYSPGVGCSPILTNAFGGEKWFGEERFSIRFDWVIGEVLLTVGPSDQRLLYPTLAELASGRTFDELKTALSNAKGRPWVVARTATFFFSIFPADDVGRARLEAFHRIDPFEWWEDHGVSETALAKMRPGGILWRDMTEDVAGSYQWVLMGVE